MKSILISLVSLILAILYSGIAHADDSYFDIKQKNVSCSQPLPIFTLGENSSPSKPQVQELCSCIWKSLPEGGWERDTAKKARDNYRPNPRLNEFIPKFGESLKKCGGYKL